MKAGLIESGPGTITGSWIVGQGCGGCGPVTTAEFFIVADTGAGPFESPGLSGLDVGWTATVVNPNYVLATGPTSGMGSWTEHYLGDILDSVTINLFFWNGGPLSDLTFAAAYSRSGNGSLYLICQAWDEGCSGQVDPTGVDYDRSSVGVPEPATLALLGLGLFGLGFNGRRQL